MNLAVLLLVLGLVTLSFQKGKLAENFKQFRQECVEETKIDYATVKKAFKGEEEVSSQTKCFFKCIFKKLQIMDDAGAVDFNVIKEEMCEYLDRAKVDAIVNECQSVRGADECDNAYETIKCARDKFRGGKSK